MSEIAKQLFDSLSGLKETVQAVAPGLKHLVPEAKAELGRLGTQGSMELASALFNGSGFVPYGPGQYTPSIEQIRGPQEMGREQPELGRDR